jgi:predicted nucleotidyltransferase/predicted transcriptional regulator
MKKPSARETNLQVRVAKSLRMPRMGIKMPKMGTKTSSFSSPSSGTNLAEALFSGTQRRVLGLLFGQPDRSFYATELIALAGVGSGAVQRELARLAQSGLVTVRPVGNQKHYQANPDSPIYAELCGIARKTVGLAEPLRAALAPLASEIHAAFVFGSVAKKTDTATSDIDLMIISDTLEYGDTFLALQAAAEQLGREVNPAIYTRNELAKRIKHGEGFVARVLSQPKVWLIGGEDDLRV